MDSIIRGTMSKYYKQHANTFGSINVVKTFHIPLRLCFFEEELYHKGPWDDTKLQIKGVVHDSDISRHKEISYERFHQSHQGAGTVGAFGF